MTNTNYYITQKLPNAIKTIAGVEIEVEQEVYIKSVKVDLGEPFEDSYGLPQIIVEYSIIFSKDGEVIKEFKNRIEPKRFTNDDKLYVRSFEQETLFQPVPNPNYISQEETPDEENEFLTMGAVDFIYGEIINNAEHPERAAYLIPFLKAYILDNHNDGWFDSENLA